MASYLRQQRIASFALGTASSALLYISTKRFLSETTLTTAMQLPGYTPPQTSSAISKLKHTPLWGPGARTWLSKKWNEGIDGLFKPAIDALVDKGL